MKKFNINLVEDDSFITVTPPELGSDTATDAFKKTLFTLCEQSRKHLLLDFKNVEYLFSRAIGAIVGACRLQREQDKKIAIVNASEEIIDLLTVVSLIRIIPAVASAEEFLAGLTNDVSPAESKQTVSLINRLYDGITVISFEGKNIEARGTDLIDKFEEAFTGLSTAKVIVDFTSISSITTEFIFTLQNITEDMNRKKKRLLLAAVNQVTRELFQALDMETSFEFAQSVEDGVDRMNRQ